MHFEPRDLGTDDGGRRGSLFAATACALVVLCAAVTAYMAWTRPARTATVQSYTQSGWLSYSAPTAPDSIYGASGVTTGQPVYTNLVNNLTISYSYAFQSPNPATLAGTAQLAATVSNNQGITRTLPLQSTFSFTGTHFSVTATLPLASVQSVVNSFEQATGGGSLGTFTVGISPSVAVHGRIGTGRVSTSFDQPVIFNFSSLTFSPAETAGGQTTTASSSTGKPLLTSATGSVEIAKGSPARMLVGIPVIFVRIGALLALAAGLLVGWLFSAPLIRDATSEDERLRIPARHGTLLVAADRLPNPHHLATVELTSFDGLMHVARRLECPIFHHVGDRDTYAIIDNGTFYRYEVKAEPSIPATEIATEIDEGEPAADRSTSSRAVRPRGRKLAESR